MHPKCFTHWTVDGKTIPNTKLKELTYSSTGFLLPCCWCDKTTEKQNLEKYGLFDESIRLSNVGRVEEVLNSEIWKKFFVILETGDQSKVPRICINKCSKLPTWGEDELRKLP